MTSVGRKPSTESRYSDLLRSNANFRRIWLGEVVSNFGDWFNVIASAALLGTLTGSGTAVGALFIIRMLAPFVVSPLAGVVADRRNRKHVLIFTDLARALVVLGFLLVREPADVWLLYLLTAVQLGLSGFFVPARGAILPELVSARDLGVANALSSATFAVMLSFGAGIGGFLSGTLGIYETFLVDAVSFFVSAALLARVVYRPSFVSPERTSSALSKQYVEGLRYLRHDRETLFLALHKGVNALFITGGLNVLMVALAVGYFPLGEGAGISLGLTFCATGVGTALGPIIARRFTKDRETAMRKGLVVCYLVSAVGLAVAAPVASLTMVLVGLVVRGLGGGMMFVFSTHLLMVRVPSSVRGRVFSTEFALRTLSSAVGTLVISLGVDTSLGTPGMLWLAAGAALVPGLLWWLWITAVPRPAAAPVLEEIASAGRRPARWLRRSSI